LAADCFIAAPALLKSSRSRITAKRERCECYVVTARVDATVTRSISSQNLRRYGPWLLILVAAAAYYVRFVKAPVGMEMYPQAAYCLLHGAMLQACDIGFTYPPIFAFLMLPLEPLPLWLRDLVWYAVTVGATIGSFNLSERLARNAVTPPLDAVELDWLRLLGLLLGAKLILAVFENQSYDALVLLFLLLGLTALASGRDVMAGAGLAFAAALKATPLIFLPYLLWRRNFVGAAAFVAVFLGASFLPDLLFTPAGAAHGYYVSWLREVAEPALGVDPASVTNAFWSGANIMNHSLHGAVALNIDETSQHGLFNIVLYAIDAAFIVAVGTLMALSPNRRESIARDGSLLLIAMLMLSPMTSRSHYVAMLLPYMTLIALGFRDKRTLNLGRVVLAISFVLVTVSGNDAVGQTVTVWAYQHSFMVLGVLVLLIYFAALEIGRRRQSGFVAAAGAGVPLDAVGPMHPAE
jgi:Glycosyltransferase family 87